jgi:hypothetical protein
LNTTVGTYSRLWEHIFTVSFTKSELIALGTVMKEKEPCRCCADSCCEIANHVVHLKEYEKNGMATWFEYC